MAFSLNCWLAGIPVIVWKLAEPAEMGYYPGWDSDKMPDRLREKCGPEMAAAFLGVAACEPLNPGYKFG